MSSEEAPKQMIEKPKRKKRKTFLTNARKYAKKGRYGRGSEMDADTYQYFVRILEVYKEGFDSEEAKSNFANNVFEQTAGKEVDYSCNQIGCRAIELLLPFANAEVLERFMMALGDSLRPLCADSFASHVIGALVAQCCTKSIEKSADPVHKDHRIKCKDFMIKVSRFLLNNLEDYVWDTYGNHVVRSVLLSLSQLTKNEGDGGIITLPDEYIEIVRDYTERLILWPQFNDLVYSDLTSALLQVILRVLAKLNVKLLRMYLKKLISESFCVSLGDDGDKLGQVFMSKPAVMLLETALQTATPKLFAKLNSTYFTGKLVELARTKATHFVIRKLLTCCADKEQFESMFDELSASFELIIEAGNTAIILTLAQTCKRLSAKQGQFLQSLMKALHCFEPEDRQNLLVICLCRFTIYENALISTQNLDTEVLSLHGTLLLQLLLEFNKPIKVVTGILSMEVEDVANLFSNSKGSHIIDSYARSQFVGEKSREKLVRKLQGTYQKLASSKYGSRSFEALWNVASLRFKLSIMEELSRKDGTWSNTPCGRIIATKINIALYKRNQEEWKGSLNKLGSSKLKELTDMLKT